MKKEKDYFDPQVLAKINSLSLRARFVVDGIMLGIHKSRAKGLSTEFEEHREYSPGDDLRRLDWKAYGKFDRYFVKEYRRTTNLRSYILLDCSNSMAYAGNGISKFEYGCYLAASLAYLMLGQQDAVGLVTFSDKVEKTIPAKARQDQFVAILKELEERVPRGTSAVGPVLQEVAAGLKGRGLVMVISDLLDDSEAVTKGLRHLRYRGNDVLVFHLLDEEELNFPFDDMSLFKDLEEDLKALTDPRAIKKAYLEILGNLIETYRSSCCDARIDYSLFSTATPLDKALVGYLAWRDKGIFSP